MTVVTQDEIAQMRQDRATGMPVADIAEKYLIGKSHVSRLTKDVPSSGMSVSRTQAQDPA